MEVLLSCNPHNEMYTVLKKDIEGKLGRQTRAALLEEVETVRKHLDQSAPHGLQFRLSPLLTGKSFGIIEYVQIIKRQM